MRSQVVETTGGVPNVTADHVDRWAFPLLHEYLSGLPNGLHSYPECQVIADFYTRMQSAHPEVWKDTRLPMALRNLLRQPRPDGTFMPTVLATCQSMVMRDFHGVGESDYLTEAQEMMWSILSGPLYRAILYVMSPNLLLLNVSSRWSVFVTGTELQAIGGTKTTHKLKLVAPRGLYPDVWIKFYAGVFASTLKASRATHVEVSTQRDSATEVTYELSWRR